MRVSNDSNSLSGLVSRYDLVGRRVADFSLSSVSALDWWVSTAKLTPCPAAALTKPVLAVTVRTRRLSPVANINRDRSLIFPAIERVEKRSRLRLSYQTFAGPRFWQSDSQGRL